MSLSQTFYQHLVLVGIPVAAIQKGVFMRVGIISATGPAGQAVALRLAASGIEVQVGSRSLEKSQQIVSALLEEWSDKNLALLPATNEQACDNELVICAAPAEACLDVLYKLRNLLEEKVLVSMVNAMFLAGKQLHPWIPARGSMAAEMQALLPKTKVSIAFQHLPAGKVADIASTLTADVLVCADDVTARNATMAMVEKVTGLRALNCGGLANAGPIEQMTAVLVNLNIIYKSHVTLGILGL